MSTYHPVEAFKPIADLIISNPPSWLSEFLQAWSSTIYQSHAVDQRQPTRTQMVEILKRVSYSAGLLQRALGEPSIREFLNAGGNRPLDAALTLEKSLEELQLRADHAANSPNLVDSEGNVRAGRGRAQLEGAISAQDYCALLIAEIWQYFRGKYPPPRNVHAATAIDLYWELSWGKRESWGDAPSNAWRPHLIKAAKIRAKKDRAEIQRHLRESARQADLFKADAELPSSK